MPTFPKEKPRLKPQEKEVISSVEEVSNTYTEYGYIGTADGIEYCTWLEAYEANSSND